MMIIGDELPLRWLTCSSISFIRVSSVPSCLTTTGGLSTTTEQVRCQREREGSLIFDFFLAKAGVIWDVEDEQARVHSAGAEEPLDKRLSHIGHIVRSWSQKRHCCNFTIQGVSEKK